VGSRRGQEEDRACILVEAPPAQSSFDLEGPGLRKSQSSMRPQCEMSSTGTILWPRSDVEDVAQDFC
jgi:hypothetical protein